jgi:hypothetical protein
MAKAISECEEETLGTHSPKALVDTMVFMAGLYFGPRSGNEHRQMRFTSLQLAGCTPYLVH